MKNIRMVISLILVMVIMCVSVIPVYSADDEQRELHIKMYDLRDLCEEAHYAYGVGYSLIEEPIPGYTNITKYLACSDTTKVFDAWKEASAMVEGYFNSYMHTYDGEISMQTATEKYNVLYEELYKMVIDRSELEKLVAFCEKENNDNGYYEAELWNDFQTEIDLSKELLADESITDVRVNDAFYELMYQFSLLCSSNNLTEDIDNSGKMTILDATYVQLYLLEKRSINSSQILVAGKFKEEDIDIIDATTIQRKCAKIEDHIDSLALELLIDSLEKCNPHSDEFELSSFKYNSVYYFTIE